MELFSDVIKILYTLNLFFSPVTLQLQYKNLLSLLNKPVIYVQIVIKNISNIIYIKYII